MAEADPPEPQPEQAPELQPAEQPVVDDQPVEASPPKLPEPLLLLKAPRLDKGETTFYILGTAHVSTASCEDAAELIRSIKPQVVMVELCIERKAMLTMTGPLKASTGPRAAAGLGTAARQPQPRRPPLP
jgi:hypothetical protein